MSDMTPAQRAWLTKLRDEGAQPRPWSSPNWCMIKGWTEFASTRTGWDDRITPAGLAALAEAEARDAAPDLSSVTSGCDSL